MKPGNSEEPGSGRTKRLMPGEPGGDGAQEAGIRHTVRRRSSAGDEKVIMHHSRHQTNG